MHFKAMLPRLGELFPDAIEVISKPRPEYQSVAYAAFGLPKAPAIMVGNEIIAEGKDIDDSVLEAAIYRHRDHPSPQKKGHNPDPGKR